VKVRDETVRRQAESMPECPRVVDEADGSPTMGEGGCSVVAFYRDSGDGVSLVVPRL